MNTDSRYDNRPIGVFDSGVGGLTVLKEIRQLLPSENLIYFGDTARVPYGGKSAAVINRFAFEVYEFLKRQNIKMLVVACNTASALALYNLKKASDVPVVGVIGPGVRAAVKAAGKSGSIGVIGTRATISSNVYQDGIKRLKSDAKVLAQPCPLFVPIVEENLVDSEIARQAVVMYLDSFRHENLSTLILACTHYPLLKPVLNDYFAGKTALIDSASETAIEVQGLLAAYRIRADENLSGSEKFYVSDSPKAFAEIAGKFLGRPVGGECALHSWQNDV